MTRTRRGVALLMALLAVGGAGLRAATTLVFVARGAEVRCGQRLVCRLTTAAAAAALAGELNRAVESGVEPEALAVAAPGLPARARAVVAELLAEPYLAVGPTPLAAPLDEMIEVPVHGAALAAGFRIGAVEPPLADVSPNEDHSALRITGRLPGLTTITLTRDGLTLPVPVAIKPRAARRLSQLTLEVTGQPTSDQLVQAAVALAEPALARPAGTRLTVTATGSPEAPLLRFRADGGDAWPADDVVALRLEQVATERVAASRMLPSHGAEPLIEPGLLSRMALGTGATYRAVGWRANGSEQRLAIWARLANAGSEPARVWLNLVSTGPTENAVWAGHKASREYLRAHLAEAGVFVTVPPRSAWAVCGRDAGPRQGVAWVGDVRLLSGSGVEWQVVALPSGEARLGEQPLGLDPIALGPPPEVMSPVPERLTEVITADDPARVVEVTCGEGTGAVGVRYRYTLLLNNTTAEAAPWALAMAPGEGQAQVAFESDGKVIETPLLTPDSPFVWIQPLAAGEQRVVHLSLLVQPGNSRPLRLRVGPLMLVAAQ